MRINEEIRAREVRVIGSDGEQLGIMSGREAQQLAYEKHLDLVEIIVTSSRNAKKSLVRNRKHLTLKKLSCAPALKNMTSTLSLKMPCVS